MAARRLQTRHRTSPSRAISDSPATTPDPAAATSAPHASSPQVRDLAARVRQRLDDDGHAWSGDTRLFTTCAQLALEHRAVPAEMTGDALAELNLLIARQVRRSRRRKDGEFAQTLLGLATIESADLIAVASDAPASDLTPEPDARPSPSATTIGAAGLIATIALGLATRPLFESGIYHSICLTCFVAGFATAGDREWRIERGKVIRRQRHARRLSTSRELLQRAIGAPIAAPRITPDMAFANAVDLGCLGCTVVIIAISWGFLSAVGAQAAILPLSLGLLGASLPSITWRSRAAEGRTASLTITTEFDEMLRILRSARPSPGEQDDATDEATGAKSTSPAEE